MAIPHSDIAQRNLDAFQDGVQDALEHNLWVSASRYIEVNDLAIPTGNLRDVSGTPLDFRKEQKIGARWDQTVDMCGKGNVAVSYLSRIY